MLFFSSKHTISLICVFCGLLGLMGLAFVAKPVPAQAEELPDLIVTDVLRIQDYVFPGNFGIYRADVKNIGSSTAVNFSVEMKFSQERVCDDVVTVEPGETVYVWCGHSASLTGDLDVEVTADYKLSIIESDESNNSFFKRFFVSPPEQRSDIEVTQSLTKLPSNVHVGDDVALFVTVTNKTKWPTGRFVSEWYINNGSDSICAVSVSLEAFESKTFDCVIRDVESTGTMNIYYITDRLDRVVELSEQNNDFVTDFVVAPAMENAYEYNPNSEVVEEPQETKEEIQPEKPGEVLGVAEETKVEAPVTFESQADALLAGLGLGQDVSLETQIRSNWLAELQTGQSALSNEAANALVAFMAYGVDQVTNKLGAGERAAVVFSYKEAYGKLPTTQNEVADVLRIANGRWPVELNLEAQDRSHSEFYKIYKRIADMSNPHDNAAITVMTYGLKQRPENRNLDSERAGIKTFRAIYGYTPNSTRDWNIMQAITYSGASR